MQKLFVVILSSALAFPQEGAPKKLAANHLATELNTAFRYRQAGRYQEAAAVYEAVLTKLQTSNG
jgi:hypothetical protein